MAIAKPAGAPEPALRGPGRAGALRKWRAWLLPFSALAGLAVWLAVVWLADYPPFILPSPGDVGARFLRAASDGSLLRHSLVTLREVLAGLALGVSVASLLGYALARSRTLEKLLSPYIVASQAIPVVALAPLLVLWFGPGEFSKVLICALIVFFPVLVNVVVGLRSVEADLRDLMRSLKASRWQTFAHLEVPAALPVLLGGLKIGATLSVIGAVVGEFVGADRGLGFLVNVARGQFDTALVFVAIFTLMLLALSLYAFVSLAERWLLDWRR